ncbi:hypothetical protein KCU83_g333, partial [Aureobasidium melanogenum]
MTGTCSDGDLSSHNHWRQDFEFWVLKPTSCCCRRPAVTSCGGSVAIPYVTLLPPRRSLLGQWCMELGLEQSLDRLYHHGAQLNYSVVPVYGMDIDSRNVVDRLHEDAICAAFLTTGLGRLGSNICRGLEVLHTLTSANNWRLFGFQRVHVAGSVQSRSFGCLDGEEPLSLPGAKRTGTTYVDLRRRLWRGGQAGRSLSALWLRGGLWHGQKVLSISSSVVSLIEKRLGSTAEQRRAGTSKFGSLFRLLWLTHERDQIEGPTEPAKPELDMLLQRPGPMDESMMLLRLACVWRFCLSGSLALEASETCDRVRRCCEICISCKCSEVVES